MDTSKMTDAEFLMMVEKMFNDRFANKTPTIEENQYCVLMMKYNQPDNNEAIYSNTVVGDYEQISRGIAEFINDDKIMQRLLATANATRALSRMKQLVETHGHDTPKSEMFRCLQVLKAVKADLIEVGLKESTLPFINATINELRKARPYSNKEVFEELRQMIHEIDMDDTTTAVFMIGITPQPEKEKAVGKNIPRLVGTMFGKEDLLITALINAFQSNSNMFSVFEKAVEYWRDKGSKLAKEKLTKSDLNDFLDSFLNSQK
jgi:hypothetical protein